MMKLVTALLIGSVALAGCERQGAAVAKDQPRPPVVAAAPAPAPAPVPACASLPVLALAPNFEDPQKVFAPGSKAFESTKANFTAAYQKSCQNGLLRDATLIDAEASDTARLFLHNAPEANVTGIYLSRYAGPPGTHLMVLESFFLTEGGTQVPSVEDLEEAIYCHVNGATPKEEEESGRCLPD